MTFQPAHKITCDEHKPGQLRNETRLAEYIARKSDDFNYFPLAQDVDKKLSQALSNTPHARQHAIEASKEIQNGR